MDKKQGTGRGKSTQAQKDDCIEAVLYRHTWEVELQGGGKQTHTRHNLAKVIKVDRKGGREAL